MNFPWGSLLAAVTGSSAEGLINLRRVCSPVAVLKVMVGFDEARDKAEIERLQLPGFSREYLRTTLATHYREAGFEIVECEVGRIGDAHLETSWSRRLSGNMNRSVIRLAARAVGSRQ